MDRIISFPRSGVGMQVGRSRYLAISFPRSGVGMQVGRSRSKLNQNDISFPRSGVGMQMGRSRSKLNQNDHTTHSHAGAWEREVTK